MGEYQWSELHDRYKQQDWSAKPSIFVEQAINYFPPTGNVLELGAGRGQDGFFLAAKGYTVLMTDLDSAALQEVTASLAEAVRSRLKTMDLDLRQPLNFEDATFDIVYAHLSLHYFSDITTRRILSDIKRILKPGGLLAFFVNSTSDPEYGSGQKIEQDFFQVDNVTKRFMSPETATAYAAGFQVILCDNQGETYKDSAIGVHNLIRFIGRKPN